MTDKETADTIRRWCAKPQYIFSWPTDPCGYRQHIRFVKHRNAKWKGGTAEEFNAFALAYADSLDPPRPSTPDTRDPGEPDGHG